MILCHSTSNSLFSKTKFDRTITLALTRLFFVPRHYASPSFTPTLSATVLAMKSRRRLNCLWVSMHRPSRNLRVRSYSSTTGVPTSQDRVDSLVSASTSTLFNTFEENWSQGIFYEPPLQCGSFAQTHDRFNWRLRTRSRMRKEERVAGAEQRKPPQRRRLQNVTPDLTGPYYQAFEDYRTRFLQLLLLEQSEEAAALKHRLSTWGIQRLEREGYCMTGLFACWLEANNFGKPVATFSLGPGIILPDNKLEAGTQVLLSRLDPLKEAPEVGSIIRRKDSSLRVCFPDKFDLSGLWRVDLGTPNLMYDRMRSAISCLAYDTSVFEKASSDSEEFFLQGTELRDVLLRSFQQPNSGQEPGPIAPEALEGATVVAPPPGGLLSEDMGAFKHDQRIMSWAKRYMKPSPIRIDGDPQINLNESQMQAMAAMIGRRISLIQGPPGTGKTKTIIETIKLLKVHFEVPQPILVCTYTNVAVDNLVEGLAKAGVKPLRVGSQGNIRPSLIPHSLDFKLQTHHLYPTFTKVTQEIECLAKEIQDLFERYTKSLRKIREEPTKRRMTTAENMLKDLEMKRLRLKGIQRKKYTIEQQMLRDVVADADVICTTCLTAACSALNVVDFPVVFLDEASMSTEPASLIPIMKGSQHLALIGDHKQLPPVIISKEAKEGGLNISLFERLTEEGNVHSVMLNTQYRMHPDIAHFPATEFYGTALQNGTVDDIGNALPGLEPPRSTHLNVNKPSVIFVDHGGNESMKGRSRVNVTEAHLVASLVEDLLLVNKNLQGRDIGVIAPYAAQITLLLRYLNNEPQYRERFKSVLGIQRAMQIQYIEVKTVDGFEGREKEVIIFSTVRNNEEGHIGFLADKKRLNVGLTRAKRGLFVLGSISTLRAGKVEYDDGTGGIISEGQVPSGDEKAGVVKKRGRGHESWQRYAQFMLKEKRVVSLHGHRLNRVLYGHWDSLPQQMKAEALAEVQRLDEPNRRHRRPMMLRG